MKRKDYILVARAIMSLSPAARDEAIGVFVKTFATEPAFDAGKFRKLFGVLEQHEPAPAPQAPKATRELPPNTCPVCHGAYGCHADDCVFYVPQPDTLSED